MSSEKIEYNQVLTDLNNLHSAYETVRRKTILHSTLKLLEKQEIDVEDKIIQEPLLYHVGHGPFLASYLHKYLQSKTDLGRTLVMFSIHDIGEPLQEQGDIIFHKKSLQEKTSEKDIAMGFLLKHDKTLAEAYEEMELLQSNEARYAKSIDKLAPITLVHAGDPLIEKLRRGRHKITTQVLNDKLRKYMERDGFLLGFFDHIVNELKKTLENNPNPGYYLK